MSPAEEIARRYIDLYNDGTPDSYGSDKCLELYAEDVEWREMPSAWAPEGRSGDRATLRQAVKEAQGALRNRRNHLHEIVAEGDRAALRYRWEAEIGVDGLPFGPRGTVLRAEVAQFITVADGKIARSHEYLAALPNA